MRRWSLLVLLLASCRHDTRTDEEKAVDRAYDAYEELADAILDAPSCPAAVEPAEEVWDRRADDFAAARRMQDDPAIVPALEARQDRYLDIAALLDAASARCGDEPGLADLFTALDD